MSATAEIAFDLSAAKRAAERVRGMLLELRQRHDLARYEYTRQIRIAPLKIPHSHPVLTLNTWVTDDVALLSTYLHEQLHWYVTWFSHRHAPQWRALWAELRRRYPDVPVANGEGGRDEASTYLHLIVNFLEIEIVGQFVGRDRAVQCAQGWHHYRWIYRRVIADWEPLGALYHATQLLPVKPATEMSDDDLRLAARDDEASTADSAT